PWWQPCRPWWAAVLETSGRTARFWTGWKDPGRCARERPQATSEPLLPATRSGGLRRKARLAQGFFDLLLTGVRLDFQLAAGRIGNDFSLGVHTLHGFGNAAYAAAASHVFYVKVHGVLRGEV